MERRASMSKTSCATITIEVVSASDPGGLADMEIKVFPPRGADGELSAAQRIALDLCEMAVERAKQTVEMHAKTKTAH